MLLEHWNASRIQYIDVAAYMSIQYVRQTSIQVVYIVAPVITLKTHT